MRWVTLLSWVTRLGAVQRVIRDIVDPYHLRFFARYEVVHHGG